MIQTIINWRATMQLGITATETNSIFRCYKVSTWSHPLPETKSLRSLPIKNIYSEIVIHFSHSLLVKLELKKLRQRSARWYIAMLSLKMFYSFFFTFQLFCIQAFKNVEGFYYFSRLYIFLPQFSTAHLIMSNLINKLRRLKMKKVF